MRLRNAEGKKWLRKLLLCRVEWVRGVGGSYVRWLSMWPIQVPCGLRICWAVESVGEGQVCGDCSGSPAGANSPEHSRGREDVFWWMHVWDWRVGLSKLIS